MVDATRDATTRARAREREMRVASCVGGVASVCGVLSCRGARCGARPVFMDETRIDETRRHTDDIHSNNAMSDVIADDMF